MTFDFDREIDKTGTNSKKWEFFEQDGQEILGDSAHPKHGAERLLPMGVADMDFRTVPEVIEALSQRAQQGVFGYPVPYPAYFTAVQHWFSKRYGWEIEPEWVEVTPGVVPTLSLLVQQFTKPGDKVLIQRPVYHPFSNAILNNKRQIVTNTLINDNGRYHMDFDDLAQKAADPDVKMALLCSPHNPVGRVWSREELKRFGEICLENDVLIVADEIHCDLIMSGYTFQPFATVDPRFEQNSVVCTAPSKTFNLAGLKTSNIVIANETLRQAVKGAIQRNGLYSRNVFGLVGCQAAYEHGEAWLTAVLAYIEDNFNYLKSQLNEHLPQLVVTPLEGTYLAWVDLRALQLSDDELFDLIRHKVKIYCNEGTMFGPEGEGFIRLNIACHRSILEEAVARLITAVSELARKPAQG